MDDRDTVRIDPSSSDFSATEKVGLLQIIRGEDIGHEFELKPGNNVVGRQKGCEIQIINTSISRKHAEILCNPGQPADRRYVISDLGSTNGTKINNIAITKNALRDGDRVQFGRVVCKFMEVDSLEKNFMKEIKKLIEYDGRTDLLQMKPFYKKLEEALAHADSLNESLAVLMMDLDGLKQINDAHGHLAGTHVIEKIAGVIKGEISPSGVVAIYGGDEFAAYLPDTTGNEALGRAEHLRKIVAELAFSEKKIEEHVTISIGVAEYPADASEMMPLVANADKALFAAKSGGRNRVVAYDPSMAETKKE